MGTSSSVAQLTGKLYRLAHDLADQKKPLNVVTLEAKRTMQATAGSALGTRPAGRRKMITVGYTIKGEGPAAVAIVGYRGPAHLINNPTRPHDIFPRRARGSRSRRRGATVLRFNAGDGGFAPMAPHPGTRGKRFYEKAKVIIEHRAPRTYQKVGLTDPLRRAFH